MENQVIQLKKKVKSLEQQLCQRTRNYLYHFKRSPMKQKPITFEEGTQTDQSEPSQKYITETAKQNETESQFGNVKLDIGNSNKLSEDLCLKTQQQQLKTEQSLDLNLQNNPFNLQLKQQNQKHRTQIENLAFQIRNMKEQLLKSKTPKNKNGIKIQSFSSGHFSTPDKYCLTAQNNKNKQIEMISEESEIKLDAQSSQKTLQQKHLEKQIKIMKKQIKKLKAHLQYEIKGSTQTKQALLISQQENYKFRIRIQNLQKQIKFVTGGYTQPGTQKSDDYLNTLKRQQSPILKSIYSERSQSTKQQLSKFKNLNQKYEQHISILQGVKRDYLKKCIQAKEQIYHLKQQNQKLKFQVKQLRIMVSKEQNRAQNGNQSAQEIGFNRIKSLQQKWAQLFKSKVHEISNCLPLDNNQQLFLFKPETIQQLISMLQRILRFCKNIQQWQKQRIHAIQRQRSNLLKILSAVLLTHPTTKDTIAEQISQIKQLKYLVNFLNREPKNIFQIISLRSDQDILQNKVNTNQQEPIQTN